MTRITLNETIISLTILREQLKADSLSAATDSFDELTITSEFIKLRRAGKVLTIPLVVLERVKFALP